jgi:hypothetical protein
MLLRAEAWHIVPTRSCFAPGAIATDTPIVSPQARPPPVVRRTFSTQPMISIVGGHCFAPCRVGVGMLIQSYEHGTRPESDPSIRVTFVPGTRKNYFPRQRAFHLAFMHAA